MDARMGILYLLPNCHLESGMVTRCAGWVKKKTTWDSDSWTSNEWHCPHISYLPPSSVITGSDGEKCGLGREPGTRPSFVHSV
jgi:hypothetical protein